MNGIIGNGLFQRLAPVALVLAAALACAILWNAATAPEATAQASSEAASLDSCSASVSGSRIDEGQPFTLSARVTVHEEVLSVWKVHFAVNNEEYETGHENIPKGSSRTFERQIDAAPDAGTYTLECVLHSGVHAGTFAGDVLGRFRVNALAREHGRREFTFTVHSAQPSSTPKPAARISVEDMPSSAEVGRSFDISVELRNNGGDGERGGVAVSFPTLTGGSKSSNGYSSQIADVRVVGYTSGTGNVSLYKSGDSINRSNGSTMSARYLLIESDDSTWGANTRRALTLRVTPKSAGALRVMIRGRICADGYSDCSRDPTFGWLTDQQGYRVTSRTVNVAAPVSATEISVGSSANGVIGTASDVDYFSFQAQRGREYAIETSGAPGSSVYTFITLYRANGSFVDDDDDGGGRASKIVWTAPSSDTYYVEVKSVGNSTGGYRLSVSEPGAAVAPSGPGKLQIAPIGGLTVYVNIGATRPWSFGAWSADYTLTNSVPNGETIRWEASVDEDKNWITVAPRAGELRGGQSATVSVSVNETGANRAEDLPTGTHTATVTFSNKTNNGDGDSTRTVTFHRLNTNADPADSEPVETLRMSPSRSEVYRSAGLEEAWRQMASMSERGLLNPVDIAVIDSNLWRPPAGSSGRDERIVLSEFDWDNIDSEHISGPAGIQSSRHGYAVTSIIAAVNHDASDAPPNNSFSGVVTSVPGLEYHIDFYAVGLLNFSRALDPTEAFRAINRAASSSPDVVNMSIGNPCSAWLGNDICTATHGGGVIDDAQDTLFVVAAGNDGEDAGGTWPASIDADNVITVAATDKLGNSRGFWDDNSSNYGPKIDIAAPSEIHALNFQPNYPAYNPFEGTSAAAPLVSGVVALLRAIDPDISPGDVKKLLRSTGNPITVCVADKDLPLAQCLGETEEWIVMNAGAAVKELMRQQGIPLAPAYAPAAPPADDHGDTRSSATRISADSSANGVIGTASDKDYFRFQAQSGREYTIETSIASGSSLDTLVTLYRANGSVLGVDADSGAGLSSKIVWTAPSSATYYVEVKGIDNSTGGYRLSVSSSAPPPVARLTAEGAGVPASAEAGRSFDFRLKLRNDGGDGARGGISVSFPTLAGGSKSSNGYSSQVADVRVISYTSGRGNVSLYKTGDSLNHANGSRMSADYLLVESDDATWRASTERIITLRVTPKRAGELPIRIRGWICADGYSDCSSSPSSGSTSDQQGYKTYAAAVSVSAPADAHGDTRSSATRISAGSSANGVIGTASDKDYFSFQAQRGREYTIETSIASGSSLDTLVTLYRSNGSVLGVDADSGAGLASKIVWTAPSSATYYIEVKGIDNSTGGYRLSVSSRAPAPAPVAELLEHGALVPDSATAGRSFDVTVELRNNGGDGEHGGISMSFPTLTGGSKSSRDWSSNLADVRVVSYTGGTGNVSLYKSGDSINHSNGSRMSARHLLIESDDSTWRSNTRRVLTLRVTPKRAGELRILVRGWICADGYSDCSRDPSSGSTSDQQGYKARVITLNAVAPAPPPPAPTAARNGPIVFSSDRDGNREIYAMNADGSGVTRLTNNSSYDRIPSWSPDGRRIAFTSNRSGNSEIYAMNADGSGVTRLTNNSDFSGWSSSWSPDGRRIAFTSNRSGNSEIYAMNADGSGVTRLTNRTNNDFGPSWSPDGGKIAFYSYHGDDNYEIYVMNADGSGVTRLTNRTNNDFVPSWSPDGRRIAFVSDRNGNSEIYVMNADGSGVTRLTNNSADDWGPSWSPDGRRIAFTSNRDGDYEIYTMNVDGSGVARLTNNSDDEFNPSWSPDGRRIAFTSNRDGNLEIYAMNADGSGVTRLTHHVAYDGRPSWGPSTAMVGSAAPQNAADDHGDSRSTATRISAGSSANGVIGTASDADYFSFQAQRGREYTIETSIPSSSDVDTFITLYRSNGSSLGENDDGGGGYASKIVWTAPSSATYYVKVDGLGDSTGGYRLSLSSRAPAQPPVARLEATEFTRSVEVGQLFEFYVELANVGGDGEHGGVSVSFPELTGGSKSSRGYSSSLADVQVVDYTSGTGSVSLYKSGDSLNHANGSRMNARHLLIESDDAAWRSSTERLLALVVTPKRAGELRVLVRGWICADGYSDCSRDPASGSASDQQGYRAMVRTFNVVAAAPADDHGDSRSSATRISSGSGANGVIGTASDADYFSFQAQRGRKYTIETSIPSDSDVDTRIRLYAANGSLLDEDDDGSDGYASKIEWTAPSSAAYYVKVDSLGYSTGGYRLSLSSSAPAQPPAAALYWADGSGLPDAATAGRSFDIGLELRNEGGDGERGGISLSFPTLTGGSKSSGGYSSSAADVQVVGASGWDDVSIYKSGDSLNHANGSTMSARHLLIESDDGTWRASSERALTLRITPKRAGEFPIRIRGWICADRYSDCSRAHASSGSATDQQGYRIYDVSVNVAAPADDHGDSRSSATRISDGSSANGVIGTASDADYFSFQAQRGREYTIETSIPSSSDVDTEITLYSSGGSRLGGNDDGGDGYASKLVWTAPSSATYYVKVDGLGDSTGGYRLSLSSRAPTPAPSPVITTQWTETVEVGQSFDFIINLANSGGGGERGGVSVSFPTLTGGSKSSNNYTSSAADVRVVSYTSGRGDVSIYKTGDSLNHANGSTIDARHLLIESDNSTWGASTRRSLTLRITPKRAGDIPVRIRGWICADGYSDCARARPSSGSTTDQQGYRTYLDTVRVVAPAPAQPPVAEVRAISVPREATVGQSFEIRVELGNGGGAGDNGGFSISFPSLTGGSTSSGRYASSAADVQTVNASAWDDVSMYKSGDAISSLNGEVPAEHLLVEARDNSWSTSSDRALRLRVTPKRAGEFPIRIAAWICSADTACSLNPASGQQPTDQQGYSATVRNVTVRPAAPADDHGDSRSSATRVSAGASENGVIGTASDSDYFSFRASRSLEYTIQTGIRSGSDVDTFITLYDANGSFVDEDDDGGNGFASKIVWTAPSSATYYVKVEGLGGSTGGYWLSVTERAQAPAPVPNVSRISVPNAATAGRSFDVTVELRNDGGDGERGGISVSFPTLTGGSKSSRDWSSTLADVRVVGYTSGTGNVSLYKSGDSINHSNGSRMSARHLLIESDDSTWRSNTRRVLTLRITPKRAGEIPVKVRGWICADGYSDCSRAPTHGMDDQQGYDTAERTVLVVAPAPADDHGDDRSSATAMNANSRVGGRIETRGDEDYFSFRAQSGAEYTIETRAPSGLDTIITLYSAQGARLMQDDDDGAGRASKMEWTAPSSGTYYVKVYAHGGAVGAYELSLSETPPPVAGGPVSFRFNWSYSHSRIEVGESFDIEGRIHSVSGSGDRGGVSISFPSLTGGRSDVRRYRSSAADVNVVTSEGMSVFVYAEDEIIDTPGLPDVTARHLLFESDDIRWSSSTDRTLKLRVTPKRAGEIPILIRGWVCANRYLNCARYPSDGSNGSRDQQGQWAVRLNVTVVDPP